MSLRGAGRRAGGDITDLAYTEEQELIRGTVRSFCDRVVAPRARQMDAAGALDAEVLRGAAEIGLFGLTIPREFGGLGADSVTTALALGEVARSDASLALTLLAHNTICATHIVLAGSPEQKRRHLPRLARGDILGAWALTEPGAGSDALALKTRAERKGSGWLLNGTKMFCTNGGIAGVVVVNALTDAAAKSRGYSAFLVEPGDAGFSVGVVEDKIGVRASNTAQLHFSDCVLASDRLLGPEGGAIRTALECLDLERIVGAAMMWGGASGATDRAVAHAKEREQFGKPVAKFQDVYGMLAGMATTVTAMEGLWLKAAWLRDQGRPFGREASVAKYWCSEMARDVTMKAIQVHGGYGLIREYDVERYHRDVLLGAIGAGTSQIQKVVIARGLGLDVEPGG